MWVAGGAATNTLAYSYDGINWTGLGYTTFGYGNTARAIAWNGSIWIAGSDGASDFMAYSYDGINWTGTGSSVFSGACYTVAARRVLPNVGTTVVPPPQKPLTENFMVAGGQGTNQLIYSYDGFTWTPSISGNAVQTSVVNGVAWNGAQWLALGGALTYSADGINWTAASNPFTTGYSAAWGGSLWVAGGTGTNLMAYSRDGINWTASTSGNSVFSGGNCYAVAWNGTLWVAAGDGANTVAYSYDGINWIASSSGTALITTAAQTVAWNGIRWVVGGSGTNTGIYSTDGINWTASGSLSAAITGACATVATNGSRWVAGGQTSGSTAAIAYSTDGISWTAASVSAVFGYIISAISWNGAIWIAMSAAGGAANEMGFSYDGIIWFPSTGSPLFSTYGLAVAARRVLPYTGTIIKNTPFIQYGSGTSDVSAFTLAVTFTTPFASTPNIQACVTDASATWVSIGSASTTGFTAYTWNASGGVQAALNWLAMV